MKIKDGISTLEIYHKKALVASLTHMQNWEIFFKFDYEENHLIFFVHPRKKLCSLSGAFF